MRFCCQRSSSLLLLLLPLLGFGGCRRDPTTPPKKSAPDASMDVSRPDEQVQPVYATVQGPAEPLAERLCAALLILPEQRRAECCAGKPDSPLSGECTRMLSAALRSKAVQVDKAAVDACVAGMGQILVGCDWVGPWPPQPPPACVGILHGTLPAKAACRSALECKDGLTCLGLSPLAAGACGAPRADGLECGLAIDPLVVYTRQPDNLPQHPACIGYCNRGHCDSPLALGKPCNFSVPCGPNRHCAAGVCVEGAFAKVGEKCTSGGCEGAARCHKGTCINPRPQGERCDEDPECKGACSHPDGGGQGTCDRDCLHR